MRITLYNLLLIVIYFLASCSESNTHISKLDGDSIVLAFGDSLTFGIGSPKHHDYPSLLSDIINISVINKGVPGELSKQGLERLPTLLDKYQPDLVILIHGGNDLLRKLPQSDLKNNLLEMVYAIKSRAIDVVILGVPTPNLLLKSANIYEEVAYETNIPINIKLLPDILSDRSLKSDIVHPNSKGYLVLAEGVANFLDDNGAIY